MLKFMPQLLFRDFVLNTYKLFYQNLAFVSRSKVQECQSLYFSFSLFTHTLTSAAFAGSRPVAAF